MTDEASLAQNRAADPRFSTWLSANAGSGKTRVLTDRVARLLLANTDPQSILCLTYTKAAASEMQNRLFKRLGEWAMLDDNALRAELEKLGDDTPQSLSHARTLFARAIETPGGLKIQTIHSFCSAVLRQFPLEAGVTPQFRELDEVGQTALIETVLDDLARAGNPALLPVARILSDQTLTDLALSASKNRAKFAESLDSETIFSRFGVSPTLSISQILARTVTEDDLDFLRRCGAIIATSDGARDQSLAETLLALPNAPTAQTLEVLEKCLLTGGSAKSPYTAKINAIPSKALRESAFLSELDRFNTIMERVETARADRIALEAAQKTAALHGFAQAFLPAYTAAKEEAGVLDFDDLIEKTAQLLSTRSLEWVLYRLDGGIEHILVDEAQDTSPPQWHVIDALAREITAGEGARTDRTIFVVGDKKQSIYSFQGADAAAFEGMQQAFRDRLANGPGLQSRELHFSFRSSTAILSTVDSSFQDTGGRGLGPDIQHRAFHECKPGRVDLWPLVTHDEQEEEPEWFDPVDRLAANDPKVVLADHIADTIDDLIKTGTIQGENGQPRPIRPGDFLILVQGRGALFDHIIRACKSRDLPMAGADRLKIGGELAVRDLLALLSFLALQEDDLSLAAALRSPLFGWSEAELYDLAQGRAQPYLWAELRDRQNDFPETFQTLNALLRQVDFLRPYELLELILSQLEGRKNLLARLGPEAEDGIDELLNQALSFERDAVPSLTGFLTYAKSEDIEIKRQSDASGDLIRVMTVHGAKGLEAPIVILPDTTRADRARRDPILLHDNLPVWRIPKEKRPEFLIQAHSDAEQADKEERQRLLYVAMTRAESWLIVCGAENRQNTKSNWYLDVQSGLEQLGAVSFDASTGQGLRFSHGDWPETAKHDAEKPVTNLVEMPDFLTFAPAAPDSKQAILSPSDLGGDKTTGTGARDEEAALRHGRQIHRLLEHLPGSNRTADTARRILFSGPDPAFPDEIPALLSEATGVLDAHPQLFNGNGLAEVDLSAHIPTLDQRIVGILDRLVITSDAITAIDFKTNDAVPDQALDVPEGILRQMGAYLEALEQIYPRRPIILQILWTKTATITDLPHGIVRQALARTTTS